MGDRYGHQARRSVPSSSMTTRDPRGRRAEGPTEEELHRRQIERYWKREQELTSSAMDGQRTYREKNYMDHQIRTPSVDIPAYLSRPLACSMPPPLELMDQRRTEGVLRTAPPIFYLRDGPVKFGRGLGRYAVVYPPHRFDKDNNRVFLPPVVMGTRYIVLSEHEKMKGTFYFYGIYRCKEWFKIDYKTLWSLGEPFVNRLWSRMVAPEMDRELKKQVRSSLEANYIRADCVIFEYDPPKRT